MTKEEMLAAFETLLKLHIEALEAEGDAEAARQMRLALDMCKIRTVPEMRKYLSALDREA